MIFVLLSEVHEQQSGSRLSPPVVLVCMEQSVCVDWATALIPVGLAGAGAQHIFVSVQKPIDTLTECTD